MSKRQLDHEYRIFIADQVGRVIRTAVKYGVLLTCVWLLREPVLAMAGKTTEARLLLSLVADLIPGESVLKGVLFVLVPGLVLWGIFERILRQRKTAYFANRVSKLESAVDPKRSSSTLTSKGRTRPEDNL